jgi:outer membrane protein, multidrug efflux system
LLRGRLLTVTQAVLQQASMASGAIRFGRAASCALLVICAFPTAAVCAKTSTVTKSSTEAEELLGLEDLVRLALEHNRQVKIDVARVEEARALYEYAASQSYPKITAQALFGGPTSEAQTSKINDLATTTPASFEGDFNFGELGVAFRLQANGVQPIFTFGKLTAAKRAAGKLIDAAEEKVHITEAEVLVNVYRAFWAYQLTREFTTSLKEGEEILDKIIRKVEELIEEDSPQVTENDRLRLVHAQATLRVRLNEAENASVLALAALRLLIGRPQDAALPIETADVEEVPAEPAPLPELISAAKAQRPEIRALAHVIEASEQWLRYRTRSLFPDLFIGGFIEMAVTTNATDQTNPFLYDRFNFFDAGLGFGIRFDLDVFTKLAEIEQAEAQLGVRRAETAAAEEAMELELRKIHLEVTGNYAKLGPAEKAFRAARGWLTAAVLAYDIGTGQADELIDAFLARATAEGDLRKTQYDLQTGSADLARASGQLVARARTGLATPLR